MKCINEEFESFLNGNTLEKDEYEILILEIYKRCVGEIHDIVSLLRITEILEDFLNMIDFEKKMDAYS